MSLEERVAKIEGILEQINERLNHLESNMINLNKRIDSLNVSLNKRIDSLFKWLIGLILGMWTTIMITLIPILLKILGFL
jgi:predicted nuclease with TOPRIM domain